jgi:hypothetical protein
MIVRRLALVVPLLLVFVSSASAFDLTGTWTGTRKCKFFSAGVKSKVDREGTVLITQDGNDVGFDTAIGSQHLYLGIANFGTEKPDKGELSLRHCRNHVDVTPFDAVGRFTVKTKTGKVKATITGITILADDDVANPNHGTCKWKLTRTATGDPGVATGCGLVVSRRAAKEDITYVGVDEAKRLHDQLMAYPLATYRYASPAMSPGSHLGFIIDDVGPSPAIAADGDRVDLYSYTSMAVAALQTQAREIERLQKAVAALEARGAAKRSR